MFIPSNALIVLLLFSGSIDLIAQTVVTGTITDSQTLESLAGATISIKGTVHGTIASVRGEYSLRTLQSPPFTVIFSFVGYRVQEVMVDGSNLKVDVGLEAASLLGEEVVVSASRMEESIMSSPVSIERMDILTIQQAATPDYIDALANLKGVRTTNTGLNYTQVNTRGFSDNGNPRFVMLVDGIDVSDPTINATSPSVHSPSELDIESLELLPGAASALYGSNAFNGIMLLKSKSPFEYQGLSAMSKQGFTNSGAGGTDYMQAYSMRYAKNIKDKIAFKANFYFLDATDWTANDYSTDRNNPGSKIDLTQYQNFDGVNLYGDEIPINLNPYLDMTVARTGIKEADLIDNRDARTVRGDFAIHYRINEKLELIGFYKVGGGRAIDQGDSKYMYRDWRQKFYKLELKSDNFFIRNYLQRSSVDKTYSAAALGAYVNEYFNPSQRPDGTGWYEDYVYSMYGLIPGSVAGDSLGARKYADRFMIDPATGQYVPSFQDTVRKVRTIDFQRNPPGASLYSDSWFWQSEVYYNFKKVKWAEIIAGGNFRQYGIFSNGTLYNEAPDDADNPQRIITNTFGAYVQIAKAFSEKYKVTGSLRYDKMKDFEGRITPRASLVYSPAKNQNIRLNFQTGFRFPGIIDQFLYFPSPALGNAVGGVPSISSRYGIYNGGSWTTASYENFRNQGGTVDPTTGEILTNPGNVMLATADFDFLKPEKLWSYEIGYKGIIGGELFVDVNYYYSSYKDFNGAIYAYSKTATTHQGQQIDAGTLWAPFTNSPYTLTSQGVELGLSYSLPKNFVVNGNYAYTTFSGQQDEDFIAMFNTPRNQYKIGFGNRTLMENLGFNINFRYQESFTWHSLFGKARIPAYSVLDAQVNYKLQALKSVIKLGGTNLGVKDYRTNFGGPWVGQVYYLSLVFNEFMN